MKGDAGERRRDARHIQLAQHTNEPPLIMYRGTIVFKILLFSRTPVFQCVCHIGNAIVTVPMKRIL
mgnify:CR=1 FL=1